MSLLQSWMVYLRFSFLVILLIDWMSSCVRLYGFAHVSDVPMLDSMISSISCFHLLSSVIRRCCVSVLLTSISSSGVV